MMSLRSLVHFLSCGVLSAVATFLPAQSAVAQWNQWRGPGRDGVAAADPPLRSSLPKNGLEPLWLNREDVRSGGWSSPVLADGHVFLYSHDESRREGVTLPPEKYPPLSDEEKGRLSPAERQAYEERRNTEQQDRRRKLHRFTDSIACLDAENGRRVWLYERESEPTRWRQSSTPAVANGSLFFIGADRQLVCVDTADGTRRWAVPIPMGMSEDAGTPEPLSSSPLVAGGKVIVLAERLIAFAAADGSVAWTSETQHPSAIYSSPALWDSSNGPRVIANFGNVGTICVDAADGRELWQVESHAGRSSPVVFGNTLLTYGGSRKGGLRRYEMTDQQAELKWTSHRLADEGSSPAVADGRVFVQSGNNFACVSLEDGRTLWQAPLELDNPRYSSPVAAGDQVLHASGGVLSIPATADDYSPRFDARIDEEGLLASVAYFREKLDFDSLSAAEQEQAWNRKVASRGPRQCVSPAVVDGKLYLRLNHGLVCYDLQAGRGSE